MNSAPDIANHVRCAEAFLEAYARCDPEEELDDPSKVALPAIVCGAFACEVALKALLELHGRPSTGHDLKQLIDKLPVHVRQQIQEGTNLTEDVFSKELQNARLAFETWRYFYEEKHALTVNVGFLGTLVRVVLVIVDRLRRAA